MQANGIREDQIKQVRGLADQSLRKPEAPRDPSNRHISLIVEYEKKPADSEAPSLPPAASAAEPSPSSQ